MQKVSKKKRSWQDIILSDVRSVMEYAQILSREDVQVLADDKTSLPMKGQGYAQGLSEIAESCGKLINDLVSESTSDAEKILKRYSSIISKYYYLMGHLDRSRNVHDYEKLKKFQPMRMEKVHRGQGVSKRNRENAVMQAFTKIVRENKKATLAAIKQTEFFRMVQRETGSVKTVRGEDTKPSLDTVKRIILSRNRAKHPFCPGERQ
ncbi:MAG: hypothetical protein A4E68_01741 [Syntrophaceae bacterium PtaB.Bin095]|nr:MAG: hypothetical protein A4E68_01741 [Syntrophaceae bacterium PtaB.Bin095]